MTQIGCAPGTDLAVPVSPTPSCSLSLSQLPFPSSVTWAALLEPLILENTTLSQLTGNFLLPAHLQLPSTIGQSSLKVLSQCVLLIRRAVIFLSHFLEILVLGLGSLLSVGTRFPTRDFGPPYGRCSSQVLHIYFLSPEDLIFWGCPPYLSSGQASL
jgi:hypothetical protein